MRKLLLFALLIGSTQLSFAQSNCFNLGNGEDGGYHATANTTLAGGTYNFTSFTIDAGVTVNVTGNDKLIVYCQGTVAIDGYLSANGGNGTDGITFSAAGTGGIGVAGGANGGNGTYSDSEGELTGSNGLFTGGGAGGDAWSGGGGAGYAIVGGDSGNPAGGFGGIVYGSSDLEGLLPGSGGGGGSGGYSCGAGGGGAGGGVIVFNADAFILGAAGVISADGGNGGSDGAGNCGGGGAGSGGAIWIAANTLTNNGLISAIGGTGGASNLPDDPFFGLGGNGSVGRIRLDYTTLAGTGNVNPASGSTFEIIDLTTTLNATTISSNQDGATYEWVDCDNGNAVIPNETSQDFTPSVDGNYAVIVTLNGCSEISECVSFMVSGIDDLNNSPFMFFPNPTDGELTLQTNQNFESYLIEIYNGNGQLVYSTNETLNTVTLDVSTFKSGMYYMSLTNDTFNQKLKFIRK